MTPMIPDITVEAQKILDTKVIIRKENSITVIILSDIKLEYNVIIKITSHWH